MVHVFLFLLSPCVRGFQTRMDVESLLKVQIPGLYFKNHRIQKSRVDLENLLFRQTLLVSVVQVTRGSHLEKPCPTVSSFPLWFQSEGTVFLTGFLVLVRRSKETVTVSQRQTLKAGGEPGPPGAAGWVPARGPQVAETLPGCATPCTTQPGRPRAPRRPGSPRQRFPGFTSLGDSMEM